MFVPHTVLSYLVSSSSHTHISKTRNEIEFIKEKIMSNVLKMVEKHSNLSGKRKTCSIENNLQQPSPESKVNWEDLEVLWRKRKCYKHFLYKKNLISWGRQLELRVSEHFLNGPSARWDCFVSQWEDVILPAAANMWRWNLLKMSNNLI